MRPSEREGLSRVSARASNNAAAVNAAVAQGDLAEGDIVAFRLVFVDRSSPAGTHDGIRDGEFQGGGWALEWTT
jgi:hypothetical protein